MDKKILIIILVVVAAGIAYFLWSSMGGEEIPQGTASIKELVARGESLTCTFSRADESGSMDGTVYVSGGKMRGDFSLTQGGQSFESHMIQDADFAYVWNVGGPLGTTGFKTSISAGEETGSENGNQTVSSEEEFDTKCSKWNPDASKFALPSDVTFQDLSQQTIQTDQSVDIKVQQCAACYQVPDETSRAQCLAALSCN